MTPPDEPGSHQARGAHSALAGSPDAEPVPGFDELGVVAFTTTRARGTFALHATDPAADVFGRWQHLADELAPHAPRLAFAHQVHRNKVVVHSPGWIGWLRAPAADGHAALVPGTAMAVTVADCVPVFIAHGRGAAAILHAGWKGTEAEITARAIQILVNAGFPARELVMHCGPAICGACYEVNPEVFGRLTKRPTERATPVDLRALISDQARALGVAQITISPCCTRCHNDRFFSHRRGDDGRQVAVIASR